MAETRGLKVPGRGYRLFRSKGWNVFVDGLWHNNPIFGMILGLCSALAVTNLMLNAFVMSLSVTVVIVVNSLIISSIKGLIPERVRMIAYMLIISSLVITVDMVLKIFLPDVSRALGPYVALIITNCIVMGRAEAFAINNPVRHSVLDALGVGMGYGFSLMVLSLMREWSGFGTLFGLRALPEAVTPAALMSIPPGAFFALGTYILVVTAVRNRRKGR